MTETELEELCDSYIKSGDIQAAFNACETFIASNPSSPYGFRKRAYLYSRQGNFENAVENMDEAIRLSPDDSSYYFFRGWWKLERGDFSGAESDQSIALRIENEQASETVVESAFFFRAFARLRQGKFAEALLDSEQVGDEFLIYFKSLGKLTKVEIVEEAKRRSEPKNRDARGEFHDKR